MTDTSDKPGLDEQYINATNASDLTVDPDRVTAADHLIAAGLVSNRLGSILIHLIGEWTAADKPPKWTEDAAVFRAELLFSVLGRGHKGKPDVKRARAEVTMDYARALRQVYLRLPSRPAALSLMAEWAARRSVDPNLLSLALYHHLNPTCPVCDGLGQLKMKDAPVLGKQCYACNGAGTYPVPLGADRVKNWLKGCAGKASAQRGVLMYKGDEITPIAERMRGEIEPEQTPEEAAKVAAWFTLGNKLRALGKTAAKEPS